MKAMKKGFNLIAGAVVVTMVIFIGLVGWFIWHNEQTAPKATPTANIKTYTDTSKTFLFEYPADWTVKKYVYHPCCEGAPKPEPDWAKTPQPITLIPNDAPKGIEITLTGDNTGSQSIDKAWTNRTIDTFNTYHKFHINGYDALGQTTNFVGPSNAEAYTDHRDLIVQGNNSVEVYFREMYRHDGFETDNFDGHQDLPIFNTIVDSIRFVK